MAKRIQLSRAKGWRMPPNTIKCDRSTQWGNRFCVGEPYTRERMQPGGGQASGVVADNAHAVHLFRRYTARSLSYRVKVKKHLRGYNLACWCELDEPCHVDVLLVMANG